ncbi:MAG: hypothetical protein KAS98_09780, partial [Deltaproteobacteria bacterium]|nr:hypothetical protein [Deltaproteobacteria bacterium]
MIIIKTKTILLIAFLACNLITNAQEKKDYTIYEAYDLAKYYSATESGIEPVFLGKSPMNEATVQVFPDGTIKVYH